MNTHGQPNKIKCDFCVTTFSFRHDLLRHLKSKHSKDVPIYTCEYCQYKSDRKDNVSKHSEKYHAQPAGKIKRKSQEAVDLCNVYLADLESPVDGLVPPGQENKRVFEKFNDDLDELLEWFRDMGATLHDADLPAMEPKLVLAHLQDHRSNYDDISSQKRRAREISAAAKKVLDKSQANENTYTVALREKLEDLKEVVDTVVSFSDRLFILEQAFPLSELHQRSSYDELDKSR